MQAGNRGDVELKMTQSSTLALNSLGLDTNNNIFIVQSDNIVLATSATVSDTKHLNITLVAACLLDSLNDLGIDVLDVPVLDTDLLHFSRMVDQISEFVCDVYISSCLDNFSPHNLTLTDGILLSIL